LRWYYSQFHKVLYIGQHSFEHFRRLGCGPRRLEFSPYCVDASCFRFDEEARNRLRSETRLEVGAGDTETVVLFSGKLSRRKGPDLLLASVARLPSEVRRNIVTVFLGSGELEATLKRASHAEGLNVRFLGFRNQTQLSRYYHAADLLVLPSVHSETWGLVINEALHHGLPCVVSNAVGSAPDLISPGVTGEVCDAESRESLSSALIRGMRLVKRANVRDACRAKVSGYTVDRAAEGIARAYWDAVNTRSRATGTGR
jgi:glycosyltransferase involved in cell wall biosynthesis